MWWIFIYKESNMKKIFIHLITLLIPFLGFTQTQIKVDFKFDNYAQETSWEILSAYGDTLAFALPGDYWFGQTDTTIFIDSVVDGTYTLNVYDVFSDGYCCPGGSVTVTDTSCADTLAFVEDDFGALYTQTLIIAPCAPPVGGCIDTLALNYDSIAEVDDGSCMYIPCDGLDTFYVEAYCTGADVTVQYNWSNMPNPNCRMASYTRTKDINQLGDIWYPYPSMWSNTAIQYGGQQPNTTYYFVGMLTDSTYTDTLVITTPDCIPGCTDPTALNYNPWANSDDGSCQAPPANCINGESNIIITITPDSYTGETSWELTDTSGNILATSPPYSITGVPVISEVCVPNGTIVEFTLMDGFGDGLCGSCYGGVDGSALVQTLCGDTILSIQSPNADFGMDTTVTYTVAPCTPNVILGCTTPGFTEYNPQANTDDGSCSTPVVLGCVDPTSPDYDSTANTMDIIPTCNYTLVITDAAQDGWFGAWLGVLQDTTTFGPFMMGPYDGGQQTFTISLSALSPVDVMFFAPGNSSTTSQQCGFYLIGPEGDTTLSGGTNAWLDPMLQFPFKYKSTPKCGDYCTDGILGCMDSTALNYDSLANMPDLCIPILLGCTNDLAFNYDPLANSDDGSCMSIIIGCMDSTAFNYNSSANTNDQLSCIPVILGCMDDTMFNYNAAANTDDGTCIPVVFGCTDPLAVNYDSTANTNNGSCISVILGCTDPLAFNYNPNANTDDLTCTPVVIGCTDQTALNYDSLANTNNGCIYPVLGCTDPTMFNYDVNANTDDGSCVPVIIGCTDPSALNYDSLANTNSGCVYPVLGCTDPTMFNYDVNANTDDGTCIPFIYGCTNNLATNYDSSANTDNGSCILPILGCTDVLAFNYDPIANTDDGSCVDVVNGCTDPLAFNYDPLANVDNNSCIPVINGCIDSTQFNYDPTANTDNGSCIEFIYGCSDNGALNFNPLANTLDNSCCYIGGCTDLLAINYNPNACYDDNSCILPIVGCTDLGAYNYNPTANVSDSTACNYDAGCYGGPGIPYWLNDGCYAWVIDVDNYCCDNVWDASCVSMYDYCQQGWPTTIEDISALGIIVYPNPTTDIITIETRLEIEVEVYDIMGKLLINKEDKRIDLSKYPNGIYNLVLIHNNKRFNTKVIKQ